MLCARRAAGAFDEVEPPTTTAVHKCVSTPALACSAVEAGAPATAWRLPLYVNFYSCTIGHHRATWSEVKLFRLARPPQLAAHHLGTWKYDYVDVCGERPVSGLQW